MQKHIFQKLNELNKKNIYPFHMPGHKRNPKFLKEIKNFIDLDFTELDETDNMHNPKNIIKLAKENLANIFGAKESYFLINGSSCGVMASIMATVKPNQNILISKNCHISVYNALIISGANPIFIEPEFIYNFAVGIDYELIEKAINKYDIKACIITSPTYQGITSNVKKIAEILHKKNIPLIVDEAHGAHFHFSKHFPKDALSQDADIVIQSLHKTLPVLTQCAVLHINSNIIDKNLIEKCLSILQTTSPSYVFMMNVENCCYFLKNYQHLFVEYVDKLKILRNELKNLKNLKLLSKDLINNNTIYDIDISRLTFIILKNVNGSFLNNLFLNENIQIEMYSENHIIAISTICDTDYGLNLFLNAIKKIDKILSNFENRNFDYFNIFSNSNILKPTLNLRQIFYSEKIQIDLLNAENQIAADFITPYPPGIPLINCGEIITKDIIEKILFLKQNNIQILGINENKIKIIKKMV